MPQTVQTLRHGAMALAAAGMVFVAGMAAAHAAPVARPAAAAAKANAAPAPAAPLITSFAQLCRIRELEMVQYNNSLLVLSASIGRESDPEKQRGTVTTIEATKHLLTETETSWQRMSCFSLLYGFAGAGR